MLHFDILHISQSAQNDLTWKVGLQSLVSSSKAKPVFFPYCDAGVIGIPDG